MLVTRKFYVSKPLWSTILTAEAQKQWYIWNLWAYCLFSAKQTRIMHSCDLHSFWPTDYEPMIWMTDYSTWHCRIIALRDDVVLLIRLILNNLSDNRCRPAGHAISRLRRGMDDRCRRRRDAGGWSGNGVGRYLAEVLTRLNDNPLNLATRLLLLTLTLEMMMMMMMKKSWRKLVHAVANSNSIR